ncbi:MAG: NAD-dependent epimerase/dehydratase family protein, partial [Bacteroidetes bacterium]|nr:NAD-dependent epimerase/dehydratase family protein [Bacteroidota bacterium]
MMILVTGGTGFLGAHLIRFLLQHQYAIRAIYRTEAAIPADLRDQVQWVACDVLDILGLDDAMQGVDYVFHCAAVVSFSAKDRRMMYNINVTGTANVIHAALTAGVKKMIHVSSIAALGRTEENIVITEKTTWQDSNLNSFYAQTKHLAELEV